MPSDGEASDQFGVSSAISGNQIVIGAGGDDDAGDNAGALYVYERDLSGNWQWAQKLTASDARPGDSLGDHLLGLSIDSGLIVAGIVVDPVNGSRSGSAYLFEQNLSSGTWNEVQKLTPSDGQTEQLFGRSNSLSGNKLFIGGDGGGAIGTSPGAAYFFELDFTEVPVDIIPRKCPNPLEVSKGSFKAAVPGTADLDPVDIELVSLFLAGVAPLDCTIRDTATPDLPFLGKADEFDCTDAGRDGFDDLVCNWDMPAVKQSIEADVGDLADGDVLFLTLQGCLTDGTPIIGEDTVVIELGKGGSGPGGGGGKEQCKNGSDDDGDGLIDCLDPDCASKRFCQP